MRNQDEKFLKGALKLTIAGFVVKILGALYRIPLYPILGSEGMGLFQMAYPIYAILLTVSSSGLNVAISKVVAERWALGRRQDARAAFGVSMVIMVVAGLTGSVALYALRNVIAVNLAKDPRAAVSIAAISPALFFASVLSALRGWFQGIEEMTVPAVSQVLEQVGRLATMFALAGALMARGLEYAAAGATFGATVGAALGVLYAFGAYRSHLGRERFREKRERRRTASSGVRQRPVAREGRRNAAMAIARIALPISLASAVFGLTELVDLSLVPGRLHAVGVPTEEATKLYGQLTGGALPFINLATVFTGALQMAIVPSITAAMTLNDKASVRRRINRALTITLALGLPAALGLYALADPIPAMLLGEPDVGPVLRPAAPAILFLAVQQVTAGILQGIGKISIPLVNLAVAIVVKAALTFVLVGNPGIGIRGAAIATSAYFGVAALLNLIAILRIEKRIIDWPSVLKLAASGAGMAVVAFGVYRFGTPLFGFKLATIGAIGAGVLIYGALALLLKAIDLNEIKSMIGRGDKG